MDRLIVRWVSAAALVLALLATACGDVGGPEAGPVGSRHSDGNGDVQSRDPPDRVRKRDHDRNRDRPDTGDWSPERPTGNGPDRRRGNDSRREKTHFEGGDRSRDISELQRRLGELGYWVGPVDGIYGHLTEQAVLAFQGVEGIARDGIYGPNTAARMSSATRPQPKSIRGDLIEIDERSQVLLVVRDGRVLWAFHTSTGTEGSYSHPNGETYLADTPNGKWTITWQVDGWRDGRLGRMWRPKYFHRDGIAIHGFPSVPAYPASHGCARVSIQAMNHIWTTDLAPKGSAVWVY